MDKVNSSQLELFGQSGEYGGSGASEKPDSFLLRMRMHEKAILFIFAFITVAIISFSLGVEKGKKIAFSNSLLERAALPVAEQKQGNQVDKRDLVYSEEEALVKQAKDKPKLALDSGKKGKKDAKGYTIQVASYKTKEFAQKEAEFLKRKGFKPLFLTKGSYTVLCVGSFLDYNAAASLLGELKKEKRYSGCLIRRI